MADQGIVSGFECEVYCKDGSTIWISEAARAVRDADGRIVCYEGTIEDITARKVTEQEIRKQLKELQRWHALTLDREDRVQALKQEVNELLIRLREPIRYSSQGTQASLELRE